MSINSDKLIEAMEVIAKNAVSNLKLDRTIQASIERIENISLGEYKVRYEDSIFSAFSKETKELYRIGEQVYVKIPENNFNERKFIEGRVATSDLSLTERNMLNNAIVPISSNLFNKYCNDIKNEYSVLSGTTEGPDYEKIVFQREDNSFYQADKDFQMYSNTYDKIAISADFRTQFLKENFSNNSNFGLKITFLTKTTSEKETSEISYFFDINSFTGNPFRYNVWTTQSALFSIQKQTILGIKSVVFFQEGFERNEESYQEDIFCKNISILFVDSVDLNDGDYHAVITAPEGIILSPEEEEYPFIGTIYFKGKNILNYNNSKCYWFKQNLEISKESPAYNDLVGEGWEEVDSLKTNFNVLKLKYSNEDIVYKQKIMFVCIYCNDIVVKKEITILKDTNLYSYRIEERSLGEAISLYIKNEFPDRNSLVGDWYQIYSDGRRKRLATSQKEIRIENYLIGFNSSTFFIEVYDSREPSKQVLSVESIFINSHSEDKSIINVSFIGPSIFYYNNNGDIPLSESEKDQQIEAAIKWEQGYGTAYNIIVYAPDGSILKSGKENKYSPKESMIKNLWYDNNDTIHFNIYQKFDIRKKNNNLKICVKTINNIDFYFEKEISFIKDGDQGTNGTTYFCSMKPIDTNDNTVIQGFQSLECYTTDQVNYQWNPLTLKVFIYNDGELLPNEDYTISCSSSPGVLFEAKSDPRNQDHIITVTEIQSEVPNATLRDKLSHGQFYIKININILKNQGEEKAYSLNYIYPIPVLVGTHQSKNLTVEVPQYIKYTSSGVTPTFQQMNPICFWDKNKIKFSRPISLTPDLIKFSLEEKKLIVASQYFCSNNKMGVLKFVHPDEESSPNSCNNYLICPIIFYLDTYGNEAINGWDGTNIKILSNEKGVGSYLLAPQIGAGTKNRDNTFSGLVMGKDSQQRKNGLYGYKNGINTFGLLEDGSAFFGSCNKGQIILNSDSFSILGKSSIIDKEHDYTMKLFLIGENASSKAIQIGGDNFSVNYKGEMIAKRATIEGKISATEGNIGGWRISRDYLTSNNRNIVIDASSESIRCGNLILNEKGLKNYPSRGSNSSNRRTAISIDNDGKLTAKNASVEGDIKAIRGTIGGWEITESSIKGPNTYLYSSENQMGRESSIYTKSFRIIDNGNRTLGSLGYIVGNNSREETHNVGIDTTIPDSRGNVGIILKSETNIGLRTMSGGGIYITPLGGGQVQIGLPGGSSEVHIDGKVYINGQLYGSQNNL